MSLRIRLSRGGAKKRPFYRIVIADSRSPRDGRFIEKIGTYNPMLQKENPARVSIDIDRAKHWLGVGALPSERVAKFLANVDFMKIPERREQTKQQLPKKKAQERLEAEKEALAAKEAVVDEPAVEEEVSAVEEAVEEEAPVVDELDAKETESEEISEKQKNEN
ncbi:MAG: 30S ribosomal protein S16 [Alphaproteobacteria bacterium]|nr:30S ribosomal protein S16 [Alphaproteobacteria bacterium]